MRRILTLAFLAFIVIQLDAQEMVPQEIPDRYAGKTLQKDISDAAKAAIKEHIKDRRNTNQTNRGGLPNYWACYADAVENSGSLPYDNLIATLMWPDSQARVIDPAGDFYWFIHAIDDLYDPNSILLNDFLIESQFDVNFGQGKEYLIDSVEFYYLYERVSAPSIVDTLRVYAFSDNNITSFLAEWPNPGDNTEIAFANYNNSLFRPASGIVQEWEILLTEADTSAAFIAARTLGFDDQVRLGKDEQIGLAVHFIPGQSYSLGDPVFDNTIPGPGILNNFDLITYEEDEGLYPLSAITDDPAINQGGIVETTIRYDINTTGWNGSYISSFAYTDTWPYEHMLTCWLTTPLGAHFIAAPTANPCEYQFSDLSNVAAETWFWEFGDPGGSISLEQNPIFSFPENGSYVVNLEVRDDAFVTYTHEEVVIVNNCITGIEEIKSLKDFSVYPNPATDMVNVDIDFESATEVTLSIINMQGQVVLARALGSVNGTVETLDISNLAKGLYLVKIENGNEIATRNFVVK